MNILKRRCMFVCMYVKITWLILSRQMIAVYSENRTEPLNTLCGQDAEFLNVESWWYLWQPLCLKGLN
jgi:hypothetical protein